MDPVVPELCGDDGSIRAGALTTLVDVIGGGLAATTAHPNWIATADLTLHLVRGRDRGVVEARARVLRAGRTTVVLEVDLAVADDPIGFATMSFAVLPRRDANPDIAATRPAGPSTMALAASGLEAPLLDLVGIDTVDAARGVVEVPVREWAMNSMGAMQGGVVGSVVEAAAETALRRASGTPLVVTDLQLTYLAFGRVGPTAHRDGRARSAPEHGVGTRRARRHRRGVAADDDRTRRRDEVAHVTQTPANMGTDIMRFARLDMHEVEEFRIEGRRARRRPSRGRDGARSGRRAPHDARLRRWLCGGLASLPDGWVVSTNLCARTVPRAPTGPLRIDSRRAAPRPQQRRHRGGDRATPRPAALVMNGVLTSAILVPENGPPVWNRPLRLGYPDDDDVDYLPMERWLDHRIVAARAVEIDLRDTLRNPWGILHGGVVAALVDLAAEHATGGGITTDVVLHFLAPNRVGPVRATAAVLGSRSDGTVLRVEVRDVGHRDRVDAPSRVVDRQFGVNTTGRCSIVVTSAFGATLRPRARGHVDVGQPREQLLEQDPDLGAGQVRAEAEVRAGAEREVQVRRRGRRGTRRGRRRRRRHGSPTGRR